MASRNYLTSQRTTKSVNFVLRFYLLVGSEGVRKSLYNLIVLEFILFVYYRCLLRINKAATRKLWLLVGLTTSLKSLRLTTSLKSLHDFMFNAKDKVIANLKVKQLLSCAIPQHNYAFP